MADSNKWVLPVTIGRTHEGRELGVGIGTFYSKDEAITWGAKLLKEHRITGFVEPVELMTLKQYDAWRASMAITVIDGSPATG